MTGWLLRSLNYVTIMAVYIYILIIKRVSLIWELTLSSLTVTERRVVWGSALKGRGPRVFRFEVWGQVGKKMEYDFQTLGGLHLSNPGVKTFRPKTNA